MEKVLVVDDEHICSFFLGRALEQEGYQVKTATRGDQAVQMGEEFLPDILISDWMLKDVYSGLDVARFFHERNPEVRIIFITGMASDALRESAEDLPIHEVLEKPVDIDDLLGVLRGKRPSSSAETTT